MAKKAISHNLKPWLIFTAIAALFLLAIKSKAAAYTGNYIPGPTDNPDAQQTPSTVAVITDYDNKYNYKWQSGRWYVQRKGLPTWIDVKNNLSPENFAIFEQRLNDYLLTHSI